mmetsp:Transcript_6428/g.18541  ORF Transcript_6428/g.18541 Transcript_6428/m.18541 type:complete len:225 (-) Transcript_6428:275-949(-)
MPPAGDGAAAIVAFLGAAVGAGLLGAAGFLISALTGAAGVFLGAAAAGGEPKRPENRPPRGETSCVLGLLGVTGFLISVFLAATGGAALASRVLSTVAATVCLRGFAGGALTSGLGAAVGPPPNRALNRPPMSLEGGAAAGDGFLALAATVAGLAGAAGVFLGAAVGVATMREALGAAGASTLTLGSVLGTATAGEGAAAGLAAVALTAGLGGDVTAGRARPTG